MTNVKNCDLCYFYYQRPTIILWFLLSLEYTHFYIKGPRWLLNRFDFVASLRPRRHFDSTCILIVFSLLISKVHDGVLLLSKAHDDTLIRFEFKTSPFKYQSYTNALLFIHNFCIKGPRWLFESFRFYRFVFSIRSQRRHFDSASILIVFSFSPRRHFDSSQIKVYYFLLLKDHDDSFIWFQIRSFLLVISKIHDSNLTRLQLWFFVHLVSKAYDGTLIRFRFKTSSLEYQRPTTELLFIMR